MIILPQAKCWKTAKKNQLWGHFHSFGGVYFLDLPQKSGGVSFLGSSFWILLKIGTGCLILEMVSLPYEKNLASSPPPPGMCNREESIGSSFPPDCVGCGRLPWLHGRFSWSHGRGRAGGREGNANAFFFCLFCLFPVIFSPAIFRFFARKFFRPFLWLVRFSLETKFFINFLAFCIFWSTNCMLLCKK